MPKVSVIIPVYNVEKYLCECLDSVINQTLKDIEIICVNDGSTDNSLEILKEYANKDNRIKVLTQKNQFAGVARNNGLKVATGEYIHFMDSDDILTNSAVYENLYNIVKNKNENIIKFGANTFNTNTNSYFNDEYFKNAKVEENHYNYKLSIPDNIDEILTLNVTPWSALYRRDFLIHCNIRFNSLKCCNDRSFNITTIISNGGCYLSDLTCVDYRFFNKNSLRGIRKQNFDCHFKSINIIKDYLKIHNTDDIVYKKVLLKELSDLFGFYKTFYTNRKDFVSIKISTAKFVNELDDLKLEPELKNYWYYYLYKKLKNKSMFSLWSEFVFSEIFSTQNRGVHKVITILGIKLKFKSKKLIERERFNILNSKLDNLANQVKVLAERGEINAES